MQSLDQVKKTIRILEQDALKISLLLSCVPNGITTLEKCLNNLKQQEISQHIVRRRLNWLSEPPQIHNFPPLLAGEDIAPAGSNGRPEKIYLLTEFGTAVLTTLEPDLVIKAPHFRDPADLAHRYITLKVAEQAEKDGLEPRIEHTFRNAVQEVRADVYLEVDGMLLIIEVEQRLRRQNIKRIREKLLRWARFIQAEGSDQEWQLQLVFNVRPRELPTLLRYWQEAFADVQREFGELPYYLYYITASELLDGPSFSNALFGAQLLDNIDYSPADTPNEVEAQEVERPDYVDEERYVEFHDALEALLEAPPEQALEALKELAKQIYVASYYPNSPCLKAAVFPWASIWLIRRYLEHPDMVSVRAELTRELTRITKRSPGMIMLRETVTSLLWDVMLYRHGLGRGGILRVVFQVPDFQDNSSDFRVDVRIDTDLRSALTDDVMALRWFFTSIYLYRRRLGLVDEKKK